jgi:parallel beta-helix repeat protein
MSTNQTGKMMIAVVIVVIIAAAGFSFITLNQEPGSTTTITTTFPTIPEIIPENQPIAIKNDSDLAFQAELNGWPGTGDPDNPYIIEDLSIVSDLVCIYITNVVPHFIIRNCALNHTGDTNTNRASIWLRNCTFGRVESCNIVSQAQGIELFIDNECTVWNCTIEALGSGLNVTLSENILLDTNRIFNSWWGIAVCGWSDIQLNNNWITDCDKGIVIQSTGNCEIFNNTILWNQIGIEFYYCTNGSITNNTVLENEDVGIILEGSNLTTLLGNKIGWNEGGNAVDDGYNNEWDDGVNLGNFWSDYDLSGQYPIPGSAGSIDHYPALLEVSE